MLKLTRFPDFSTIKFILKVRPEIHLLLREKKIPRLRCQVSGEQRDQTVTDPRTEIKKGRDFCSAQASEDESLITPKAKEEGNGDSPGRIRR
jgi:hypothetical protein